MSTIIVTRKTATVGVERVKLVDCTASQQFIRLCDTVGRALGVPALDQKVRSFVTKVQNTYNKQLDSRARSRVWEAGRIVVKNNSSKKFSPFTWNLPRSRTFNASAPTGAETPVSQPDRKQHMATKKPATAKSNRVVKHEITLPAEGTTCRKIFDMADRFDGVRAKVLAECEKKGVNAATATTQFGKWRVFNGLKGRAPKAKKAVKKSPPPAPRKKVTPPAPPAAA